MSTAPRTEPARLAANGMVCTVDHVASAAGVRVLAAGGNAADAAVAASAVLAVTTQYMCGMGGDLWALVHHRNESAPASLNASGRAGSGVDASQLRAEGHVTMPYRGDLRSTPVPGCVDGWLALLDRFGRADLATVFGPAIEAATSGFAAAPFLAAAASVIADVDGNQDFFPGGKVVLPGQRVTRPGLARALSAIVADGREGWYGGEFGAALIEQGQGIFTESDLALNCADWNDPVRADAWGSTLWTSPPNSQGYLSLAGAVIADGLDLPEDPSDPLWAHLLIESAKQAGFDRSQSLFEGADGAALVSEERLGPRRDAIDPGRASALVPPGAGGGTIYLCAVDEDRMGVSLIQSNASGFGAHVAIPSLGVFLHNRGIGFSLEADHPAELAPGRRPPSTLSPALITNPDGSLRTVLGTMGGDGQPQVVLQMMAHLLQAGSSPGQAISDPRFTLTVPDASGFDTWSAPDRLAVAVEQGTAWADGLRDRGHQVNELPWGTSLFGHAHLIDVVDDHLAGVAEPRVRSGAAVGI